MAVDTARAVREEKHKLRRRAAARQLLRACVCFVLGFTLSGASAEGHAVGAGVAMVGAAGTNFPGFGALLGASLGYLLLFGYSSTTWYLATGVMIYTVGFVCQYLSCSGKKWFMPATAMIVMGIVSCFGTVSTLRYEVAYVMRMIEEIILCGGLTYAYAEALRVRRDEWYCKPRDYIARMILLGSVCNALSAVSIGGYVSLGRVLSLLLTMAGTYGNDTALSVCGAGVIGLLISPDRAVMYAVSAWVAKWPVRTAKWQYGLWFGAAWVSLSAMTVPMGEVLVQANELGAAVVLFWLMQGNMRYLWAINDTAYTSVSREKLLRCREALRLRHVAEAMEHAAQRFAQAEDSAESLELLTLMDRAMDVVCENCGKRHSCRSSKRVDMLYLFMSSKDTVERRGCMLESDLPDAFRERCYASKTLVLAVNYELRQRKEQENRMREIQETTMLAGAQYYAFGRVLRQIAGDMEQFSGGAERAEHVVMQYFLRNRLQCSVNVFYSGIKRMSLQITGRDVAALRAREGYLEELSRMLQLRLCVPQSSDTCVTLYEAEPLAVTMGVASRRKQGERVSGDLVKQFKTDRGLLYIILSDGMGTGTYAQTQSVLVVSALESLLQNGVAAESAIMMVNDLAYFRNREDWGYATLDMAEINLFTGEAIFYKLGSAASCVYDGRNVRLLAGTGLPIGMEPGTQTGPDIFRLQMKPGAVGVLASDGVCLAGEEWLEQLLKEERSMKGLSRRLLLHTDNTNSGEDDATVVTFMVELRQ